jgi:hypothetical protein
MFRRGPESTALEMRERRACRHGCFPETRCVPLDRTFLRFLEGRLQHELLDESSTSARRPILSISLCSEIELILRAYGHDSATGIWEYIVQRSMGLPYLAQALYKSYHALPLRSHTTMDSPRAL